MIRRYALLVLAFSSVGFPMASIEATQRSSRTGLVVFLWSHPRALSTALLRSLAELPHTTTVLEPFMIPWQSDIGVLNREKFPAPLSFDQVHDKIEKGDYYTREDQFIQVIKDMPVHLTPQLLNNILERFPTAKHVFLVRHPHRMIPSYFKVPDVSTYPADVIEMDVAYKPLLDLAERLAPHAEVLLLDAETLLGDPTKSLTRFCQHVGTYFVESLLHWEPVLPSSWHDLEAFEGWLDNVAASSGWKPRPVEVVPPYPKVETELERHCVDSNVPIYELLLQKFASAPGGEL